MLSVFTAGHLFHRTVPLKRPMTFQCVSNKKKSEIKTAYHKFSLFGALLVVGLLIVGDQLLQRNGRREKEEREKCSHP